MSFVRRHRIVFAVSLLMGITYYSSWTFRREIGLVQPMANVRYFHFGVDPDTFLDRTLYWFYYPAYRPYLAYQMIQSGERYDVHWSDTRDPALPTPAEVGLTDADVQ